MHNQNAEVKILIACCIAEILRIFAPDAPYGDPHQLKTVLMFLIKQLRGLDNPKDPVFVHYYLLLENLSIVKTLNIVLELEESPEFVLIMIKLFFAILQSDDIPEKVQGMLIEILISIIKECDHLSVSALDALLVNLVEPHKTQNRIAYRCARDVIDISGTSIHPFLESYLLSIITEGKNAESTLGEYVFEITYEIQKIMPAIIVGLNAQLEDRIKSSDVKDRLETVRLLARLFSDRGATVFTDCPTLWTLFLSRFNDISPEIRLQCLKSATELLFNHLTVRQDICEALIHRFRDTDDNVRTQAITTMMTVGKKDFGIISEEILNCIKDRTLDKKII
uniref:Uncharacterized protein n=1 Tax=Romanomermis culicivorax TaxID=13658 RepID=A0A915HIJ7_ROMCU